MIFYVASPKKRRTFYDRNYLLLKKKLRLSRVGSDIKLIPAIESSKKIFKGDSKALPDKLAFLSKVIAKLKETQGDVEITSYTFDLDDQMFIN